MSIFLEVIGFIFMVISIIMVAMRFVSDGISYMKDGVIYAALMCGFFIAAALWARLDLIDLKCQASYLRSIPADYQPTTHEIYWESYNLVDKETIGVVFHIDG